MRIIETQADMREENVYMVCELLTHANKALEEAMFKLKELKEMEFDFRSGSGGNYRMWKYPMFMDRYRDDFRRRG